MKNKLLFIVALAAMMIFPKISHAQVPNLGTAADFVLFTTNGAVTNTGITHLTGHVGTNVGSSTGFGNVDGVMHDQDPASAAATMDLNAAYLQLDAAVATFFPGILLGNGQTLNAGVYSIGAAATMNGELNLDGQGDPNAYFIIQIEGTFGANSNSKVNLLNGAQACNVFWKIEGQASLATLTTMKGTLVANNSAIALSAGVKLEGRALSINGGIGVDAILGYTPLGCLAPILTGPPNQALGSTECFGIFSAIGDVTNVGITSVTGDIGTDNGTVVGYNPLLVTGTIHPVPDGTTAQCAVDFTSIYNDLVALPYDIELLYPNQLGNSLVVTPHVYLMNGAVTFTDTLFLNAQGNSDAVFVFQVYGAFSTSTYSNVVLMNGAQAKNVYWMINGAIDINDYSTFSGTIIAQGAINLMTGVTMYGRALTGVGAINTAAIDLIMPTSCAPFTATQPMDTTVCDGNSASFTVIATGINLTYQWRRGAVNLVNGGNISGANSATLIINPATILDQATDYNVIVSGSFTPNDTSNFVSLTIDAAPLITTQPMDQTVCEGDSVDFSVIASGLGNTYQWRKGLVNLIDGGSISGATTSTLSINPVSALDAALDYNVVVSGTCLPDAISNDVSLTVNTAPIITSQPTDQTECEGNSVSFSVVASGSGLNYQWRKGLVNLVNGGSVSGALTSTLTINPVSALDAALDYNVVITGTCLPDVISNDVSLTIDVAPLITTQPMDQTECEGNSVSFSVIASGSGLTYQWRKGLVNLVNGGSISGALTSTLTMNPVSALDAALDYNVVVTGACLPDAISNDVSLIVNVAPLITTQPMDQTVCEGDSVDFSVIASGLGNTYQWRKGLVNLIDGGSISGATTSTLSINPVSALDAALDYNVVVSGICLPDAISNDVSLTVNTAPIITSQPTDQTECEGNSVSFSVVASGSGLNYQWRKGLVNLIDGGAISGATTSTLSINPVSALDAGIDYNVVITGTCSPNKISNVVSLTIDTAAVITTQPEDQVVCEGNSVTLSVVASGLSNTYQWRKGLVNLVNGGSISGATTSTLTINPVSALDAGIDYNVVVTGPCLPAAVSNYAVVSVNNCEIDLSITKTASEMQPFLGSTVEFTVVASNISNQDATGVQVIEQLQSGFSYVSYTSSNGSSYDPLTGIWTVGALNSGESETLIITATVLDNGVYLNTVSISGNESENDLSNNDVTIELFPIDFHIPEGFSPNDDLINDLFVIRGISFFPSNHFTVFNRWGNLVFEEGSYLNTWDGTSQSNMNVGGDKLPVGTYFYVLDLGNGTDIYKGTIYLNN